MAMNQYVTFSENIKIDGGKVRKIREVNGLTQLYLATVVGVTTDTISRWENNRYPAIKIENALKLAEALNVALEEILEDEAPLEKEIIQDGAEIKASGARPPEKMPGFWHRKYGASLAAIALLLAVLLLYGIWRYHSGTETATVSAHRFLPTHTAPEQPFPVMISVSVDLPGPFSLIVKEILPDKCEPLSGDPPFTVFDQKNRGIKWISKSEDQKITFFYMARVEPSVKEGERFTFAGAFTLKKGGSVTRKILGASVVETSLYHWADTNRDNVIDDEEILSVYDQFSAVGQLGVGINLIEEIWSGSGYYWNNETKRFVVAP